MNTQMNRRAFVGTILVGGIVGCISNGDGTTPGNTRAEPAERDQEATEKPTNTGTKSSSPTAQVRSYDSTATLGSLECTFSQLYAKWFFRYYNPETEELKRLWPSEEIWFEASIRIQNLGGEAISRPEPSQFSLIVMDQAYSGDTQIPRISWENLRLRDHGKAYWFKPGYLTENTEIEPGEDALLYLLFDVPLGEDIYLNWSPEGGRNYRLSTEYLLEPEYETPPQ